MTNPSYARPEAIEEFARGCEISVSNTIRIVSFIDMQNILRPTRDTNCASFLPSPWERVALCLKCVVSE